MSNLITIDKSVLEQALKDAFTAGYENGYNDRDHGQDRNSMESADFWVDNEEGLKVIGDLTVIKRKALAIDTDYQHP